MLKILHTGDLHIGRKYLTYNADISELYIKARITALENVIHIAEENNCDYIVVAGDVFETKNVSVKDIKTVCDIFGKSSCGVIVIPGNHDYYTGDDDKLWNKFRECSSDNTVLLTKNEPFRSDKDNVVFYPCICDARHSETNRIGWIKDCEKDSGCLNIGIAHGETEPFHIMSNSKYYYMSDSELNSCNMDLWLIGHIHIPYPNSDKVNGCRIFNAGTHQATDVSNDVDGSVFLINIDDDRNISAERIKCGVLRFTKEEISISRGQSLKSELENKLSRYDAEKTSLKIILNGIADSDEYNSKNDIYKEVGKKFIYTEVYDSGLEPEITSEMIDSITIENSPENRLLKLYTDRPDMLHLAYELIKDCRKG